MRTVNAFALLAIGLISASFTPTVPPNAGTGTYGVCSLATNDAHTIKLEIGEDNTFRYVDNTDASNSIDVSGTWEMDGRTFVLRSGANSTIYEKWTLDKASPCLHARHGLTFMRLCQLSTSQQGPVCGLVITSRSLSS